MSAADVRTIATVLGTQRDAIRARPVSDVVAVLGAAGERFLRDGDPTRTEALENLPASAGFSPQMARVVLDGMARDWTSERLDRLVSEEFSDPLVLDGFRSASPGRGGDGPVAGGPPVGSPHGDRSVTAIGPRLCVQIVSGSVPGVSVNALIRSLLVKSPTLLKPGLGDLLLPKLFIRALREIDADLADAVAVVYWPGGTKAVEEAALSETDVAVLYGSDDTVATLRAMAPATTRVVAYHHRFSICVVGREALGADVERSVQQIARAVAMFDQRGCVSPNLVLVEGGAACCAEDFSALLADALADLEATIPSAALSNESAAALQQVRGTAEMHAATGGGRVWHGGKAAPWTVIYEAEPSPGPSTSNRGVRVRAIADLRELTATLESWGPHLQTIGVAGLGERASVTALELSRIGATRLVPIEHMSFPPPWWLHDGRGVLRELVRWSEFGGDPYSSSSDC